MTVRTFTITITTTDEAEPGPFGRTIAQDHSADSLYVLLQGLLDGVTGVQITDAEEILGS